MKKSIISVITITSLLAVTLAALKFRLKPPKKEFFSFEELLKEEEQERGQKEKQALKIQEIQQDLNEITENVVKRCVGQATKFQHQEFCDKGVEAFQVGREDFELEKFKRELSGALYEARDALLELTKILNRSYEQFLDETDVQKVTIKLLKDFRCVLKRQKKKGTFGDLTLVARHLQDPDYLFAYLKHSKRSQIPKEDK
ncbi:hypothetical protein ACN9TI_14540 [Lactococcus lactis]